MNIPQKVSRCLVLISSSLTGPERLVKGNSLGKSISLSTSLGFFWGFFFYLLTISDWLGEGVVIAGEAENECGKWTLLVLL